MALVVGLTALGSGGSAAASTSTPAQCAAKAPIELPVNAWAPARRQLAPAGASAIRLCRYNAFATHPLRSLARSALVTSAGSVTAIVAELDELPALPRGAFSCPLDDGAEIDALLAYPGGNGVVVQIDLTGCATVSNGSVMRTAGSSKAGRELLAETERLTRYRSPAG
ncbi:MAG TPA: hypothetical protein VHM72_04785 [Solirubrobacteraceae bacterium]|nr:hypothetical protein [Solirubrobacteraceae bacterium]